MASCEWKFCMGNKQEELEVSLNNEKCKCK